MAFHQRGWRRVVLLTAAWFWACLAMSAGVARGAEAEAIRVGYFANVTHAQALVGVARGDFERAFEGGSKLEFQTFPAGPAVIEAIFAGRLDIAYIGPSPTINGFVRSEGREVRVVSGAAANGVVIVVRRGSGIETFDQLRGHRIASPQLGNTQDISAKSFVLDRLKVPLKERGGDTEVIPVANPDIEILFQKGQIDAAWIPEPWGARLVAQGTGTILGEEKDLWPDGRFALTNVIARKAFLDEHPDLVKKFLGAHVALTHELAADPQALRGVIQEQLKRLTTKEITDDVLSAALSRVQFTTDPGAASLEAFYVKGRRLELLPESNFDLKQLIDTRLLDEITSGRVNETAVAAAQADGTPTLNLVPTPMAVARSIGTLARDGLLWESIRLSMGRMLVGYLLSVLGGLIIGVLCARVLWFRLTVGSAVLALQSLPSICWLPFALIWVGINERAIIVVVVLGALFSIAAATEHAIRNVAPIYHKVGLVLGARGIVFWKDILIFAALPELVGGLKLGWSFAWRSLMAAELIRQDVLGVGRLLETGRQFNDVPMMVASMLIILTIGLTVDRVVFGFAERRIRKRWGLTR
jgi:NitT/TauT family transport system substrate-binding protein